ncbi:MAG: hypothetical protein CFE26_03255 [Verrucomicrobiales bacterium VVV1]|nr:MAG: hypothetical protein CFE26_03255 [Verrucomicrobiales bacterium VVV1]
MDELNIGQEMIRLFAICLTLFAFAGCLRSECSNEPIAEVISPDGTKKIELFSRNCGATTGSNTQGTVLIRGDSLPNEPGSAFVVDGGSAKISWAGDSRIVVTLERGARAFKKETSDKGVKIEYQSK